MLAVTTKSLLPEESTMLLEENMDSMLSAKWSAGPLDRISIELPPKRLWKSAAAVVTCER